MPFTSGATYESREDSSPEEIRDSFNRAVDSNQTSLALYYLVQIMSDLEAQVAEVKEIVQESKKTAAKKATKKTAVKKETETSEDDSE